MFASARNSGEHSTMRFIIAKTWPRACSKSLAQIVASVYGPPNNSVVVNPWIAANVLLPLLRTGINPAPDRASGNHHPKAALSIEQNKRFSGLWSGLWIDQHLFDQCDGITTARAALQFERLQRPPQRVDFGRIDRQGLVVGGTCLRNSTSRRSSSMMSVTARLYRRPCPIAAEEPARSG
jgi:hypothetical protein